MKGWSGYWDKVRGASADAIVDVIAAGANVANVVVVVDVVLVHLPWMSCTRALCVVVMPVAPKPWN